MCKKKNQKTAHQLGPHSELFAQDQQANVAHPNNGEIDMHKTMAHYNDQDWMQYALTLADKAEAVGEIPVGAVLVKNNEIIAEGWNLSIIDHNACAHAEMMAITQAGQVLKNYRLIDCTLYVTLEPCPMCAGALVHARIKRLVYGAADYKTGAAGSIFDLVRNEHLNHQLEVTSGVCAEQCAAKISDFFKRRRKEKKALKQANKGKIGNI